MSAAACPEPAQRLEVVGPLVMVLLKEGRYETLRRSADVPFLPSEVDDQHLEHLLENGFLQLVET